LSPLAKLLESILCSPETRAQSWSAFHAMSKATNPPSTRFRPDPI
jgi:hypothetical protein